MAVPKKTKNYLDKKLAKYDEVAHKTVYTAYDAASTMKRELKEIAKSLLVAADKAYVMVIIPAHMKLDMPKLKKALSAKKVSIPNEKVMVKVFKVKPGAMTAFGGLHKLETLVDKSLLKTKDVILSAGSFTDSVRMKAKDFIAMEEAKLANIAKTGGYKKPPVKKKKAGSKKKKTAKKPAGKKKTRSTSSGNTKKKTNKKTASKKPVKKKK